MCVRVWIGMWRKQEYEGEEMYVRHIRMRGEREWNKSNTEVNFVLSVINGKQLKILTYPRRGILVEGTGTIEHRIHSRNTACVEVRDVTVEGSGPTEHMTHSRNAACVEVRDFTVEGGGTVEHRMHIRNTARSEVRDVTVEGGGTFEHRSHGSGARSVPS